MSKSRREPQTETPEPVEAVAPIESIEPVAPSTSMEAYYQYYNKVTKSRGDGGTFGGTVQTLDQLEAMFLEQHARDGASDRPAQSFRVYQGSAKAIPWAAYPPMLRAKVLERLRELLDDPEWRTPWLRVAMLSNVAWSVSRLYIFLCGKAGEMALSEVVLAAHKALCEREQSSTSD